MQASVGVELSGKICDVVTAALTWAANGALIVALLIKSFLLGSVAALQVET